MSKYPSGASAIVVVFLILGVVAALVIGNVLYKNSTTKQATNQTELEPQEALAYEENNRPQQQEIEMRAKPADESTKQVLTDQAMLDIKGSLLDPDGAKFEINTVRFDVRHAGSREDVVCGNVSANKNPDGKARPARFVWHSSGEIEMEGEDNKALFQLAWSLFCRA
ncbi:MAG: hypothetical protein Q8O33_14310 [Pseudomonadota bacterium]|nr:hypothetical protein [Pseudomonadota bacterium]